ncbi:MAG: CPBP family intramembrane glutamic endopeptidase [bacterium JZ-2024 1]
MPPGKSTINIDFSSQLSPPEKSLLIVSLMLALLIGWWVFSDFSHSFWFRIVAFSGAMFSLSLYRLRGRVARILLGSLSGTRALGIGALSALAFYLVAYLGFYVISVFVPGSRSLATSVYLAGEGVAPYFITVSLLCIAVLEEFFWRGWATPASVRLFSRSPGVARVLGVLLISTVYAVVHISSANLLLVFASFLASAYWSSVYLRYGSLIVTITSHFLWDVLVFQVAPLAR